MKWLARQEQISTVGRLMGVRGVRGSWRNVETRLSQSTIRGRGRKGGDPSARRNRLHETSTKEPALTRLVAISAYGQPVSEKQSKVR